MLVSLVAFFSILSLISGIIYLLLGLKITGVILSAVLTLVISWKVIPWFHSTAGEELNSKLGDISAEGKKKPLPKKSILLALIYLVLLSASFYVLFTHQTAKAIISPWQVVPYYFFILYFLSSLTLVFAFYLMKNAPASWLVRVMLASYYFLSFSVALIIYQIGYGFDPFIHEAALKVIGQKGVIEPITIYYSAYYGLTVILHKLLFIPLAWLNTYLVPVLGALVLPSLSLKTFTKLGWRGEAVLLAFLLLVFPFSFLILTTPQNLAFLLVFIIILLSLTAKKAKDYLLLLLLSLTAFFIHPLAGIPVIFFSGAIFLYSREREQIQIPATRFGRVFPILKKYFYFLYYLLCSFSLPAAFYIFEKSNGDPRQSPIGAFPSLSSLLAQSFRISLPDKSNIFLNFSYFLLENGVKIIILLVLIGLILAVKEKWKKYKVYFYLSLSLFLSYFLTEALSFSYLINYERSAYSDRILFMAFLFLLPFILLAFRWYLQKLLQTRSLLLYSNLIFITILLVASLYSSYPRYDAYFNSRGYSTGNYDLEAVRWIETDAGSPGAAAASAENKFIALANQQVSAAALREFGFKHYLITKTGEEIFNYPIPTGGVLYQYYLAMVYDKPLRKRMLRAIDLAGAKTGYFVLNKYWFQYPKVLEEAKLSANSWKSFGDGEVVVFKYIVK